MLIMIAVIGLVALRLNKHYVHDVYDSRMWFDICNEIKFVFTLTILQCTVILEIFHITYFCTFNFCCILIFAVSRDHKYSLY